MELQFNQKPVQNKFARKASILAAAALIAIAPPVFASRPLQLEPPARKPVSVSTLPSGWDAVVANFSDSTASQVKNKRQDEKTAQPANSQNKEKTTPVSWLGIAATCILGFGTLKLMSDTPD